MPARVQALLAVSCALVLTGCGSATPQATADLAAVDDLAAGPLDGAADLRTAKRDGSLTGDAAPGSDGAPSPDLGPYELVVAIAGPGSGTVSSGNTIQCPMLCSAGLTPGTQLTLTAVPDGISTFAGWTGCDSTQNTQCTITADSNRTVTATFSARVLTLAIAGADSATGSVSGDATCATGTCTSVWADNAIVMLQAQPGAGFYFSSWSGDCSGSQSTCAVTMSSARSVTAHFTPPNHMFVTSGTSVSGSLGTTAAADAICATAAAGHVAGTNWVAWLATSTATADSRLVVGKNALNGAARGWVRPDGRPFADTVAGLTQGQVFYPPRINELGVDTNSVLVATGTNAGGDVAFYNCTDWTAPGGTVQVGESDGSTGHWTAQGTAGCGASLSLYCFSVDYTAVIQPADTGRVAFVTAQPFIIPAPNPSPSPSPAPSGRVLADQRCQSDAAQAHLSGTYLAFMATLADSAAGRFGAGATWVRPDGVKVVDVYSDLLSASTKPLAAIDVAADGSYVMGTFAFTGAANPTAVGAVNSTCNDWNDNTLGTEAGRGDVPLTNYYFSDGKLSCNYSSGHVYCLQQ